MRTAQGTELEAELAKAKGLKQIEYPPAPKAT